MKISTILKALYPELSNQDLSLLEKKLREKNLNEAPQAVAEIGWLALDIYSVPSLVKDVGTLAIKLPGYGKKILPAFMDMAKTGRQFFFDKEGLTSLRAMASSSYNYSTDFVVQMQAYLKTVKPNKVLRKDLFGKIPLWNTRQILSPEKREEFSSGLSILSKVMNRVNLPYASESIWWTDDIRKIVGDRTWIGAFLPSKGIFVLDIRTIQMGIQNMVHISLHEKIHYILSQKGIAQYIARLGNWDQRWHTRAFEEGITEYLTEYFMRQEGYNIAYGSKSYSQQVLAVYKLLDQGKDTEILIDAIKNANMDRFLQYLGWDKEMLKRWIMGNLHTVSKANDDNLFINKYIVSKVHAASDQDELYDGNYESNIKSNLLFEYQDVAESIPINQSSYTLIGQLSRILNEYNLEEISIEDETSLKLLLLSGEIINGLNSKKYVSIEEFASLTDDLNNYSVTDYNPDEYDVQLPPIGDSTLPY